MKTMSNKIIFAGGGTGGHLYPALATIEALQQRGQFDILFVGGYRGIENQIIPDYPFRYRKIWISGFQRFFTLQNILFPIKLLTSLLQSLWILFKFKPSVVVGTGGYVSGPVVYVASKLGIPTLIQEQDSYPGVTTRLLGKYSDIICVPYPAVISYLKKVKGKVVVTGVPVRRSLQLIPQEQARSFWGLQVDQPVIFIFGGSQGAHAINRAIKDLAEELIQKYKVQLLWQVGKHNYAEVSNWSISRERGVKVFDYIREMDKAYSASDLIISRAGAITLAELAMVQRACILVPYPLAAAQHQEKNAQTIVLAGAAILVREDAKFTEKLREAIEYLFAHPAEAARMGQNWKSIYAPQAADKIADQIIKLLERKNEN